MDFLISPRSKGQGYWYLMKGLATKKYICEIWKHLPQPFRSYGQGYQFWNVGQTPRSRTKGQSWWYPKKGLVTRMNYVKYECTNPNPFKVTVKVCFLKVGQTPRSRSKFLVSYEWSSQNDYIHVSMKALFLIVQKLWPRLRFFFYKDGNLQGQGQKFIVVGIQWSFFQ